MNDINDLNSPNSNPEEALILLKEKGITFKGASKAFSTFLVLWFLSKEDMHGYRIMKKIDEFFSPQIKYGLMKSTKANKIYPLLKSMKENKLIESYHGIHKKKEVKIYKLTEEGKEIFNLIRRNLMQSLQRDVWRELIKDLDTTKKE